ncbi:hypothetical protein AX14_000919 [Amanita brunnescens Koide BX004]|nr:hypothetical protein AX14_000919 [Amanita brunnescens Koide BX004]
MTDVNDVPSCGQLLRAAAKTLETLELWAPSTREPKRVGDNISLNWLPALRSFQIRGLLFSPTVCSARCLEDIFSVDAPHDVEEIHLLVDTDNRRSFALDWTPWTQLDIILSSPLFRSLISVDVTLYFSNPDGQIFLNTSALRRSMPRLLRRGILNVHCQY